MPPRTRPTHALEGDRLCRRRGVAGGLGASLIAAMEALQALAAQRVAERAEEEQP